MKKILLIVVLIPLVLFEIYLCTTFLPLHWQHAISDGMAQILPKPHDMTPITHPLLGQELDQVLREHIVLRIVLYAVTIALLVANTWLIWHVWRILRTTERQVES